VLKMPSAKVSQAIAQLARGVLDRRRTEPARGAAVAAR
jgi:hypothetical protein